MSSRIIATVFDCRDAEALAGLAAGSIASDPLAGWDRAVVLTSALSLAGALVVLLCSRLGRRVAPAVD